ncbi:MAG: hypothetical protein HFE46_07150 [Clostridia bacterium]|nr:hypothetical protein [Clostridia bacterium]
MKKAADKLKNNYVVVQSWMVRELGLKGNSAIIYALIYGFSQAEGQVCTCGDDYMAAWINSTPRAVINIKNSLLLARLIEKVEGFDGDKRFSGYRVVQSKIGEKSSCKSLPTVNKTHEESSPIPSKTCEKSSHKSGQKHVKKIAKIGEVFSEIGEVFSPDNKLYKNNNSKHQSVCLSNRACAREDETDGQTDRQAEKEFYAQCIRERWDAFEQARWGDDPLGGGEYKSRLNSIVSELMCLDRLPINGREMPTVEVLKTMVDLFRDPTSDDLLYALMSGCTHGVKKKFNYTVTALYNAAKQF